MKTMKTLNKNTKQAQRFIDAYEKSEMQFLPQAYKNPSSRKWAAYDYCEGLMQEENGWRFRIIRAGCQLFTVAWTRRGDGALRIETAYTSYIIPEYEQY